MQPNPQPPQNPMQGALQQVSQGQQPAPSIDPQLSQSVIDNLKSQSQQIEQVQSQMSDSNDMQSQQASQALKQKQSTISRALGQLNDSSMQGKIGQANATGNYSYSNQCLRWVDDQQGNNSRQPTAIADYQTNATNGNIKTDGTPPKGSRVYFSSPTIPAGHVGISNGDGTFTSATDNGIQTFNIKSWQQYAGQSYLGYSTAKK